MFGANVGDDDAPPPPPIAVNVEKTESPPFTDLTVAVPPAPPVPTVIE